MILRVPEHTVIELTKLLCKELEKRCGVVINPQTKGQFVLNIRGVIRALRLEVARDALRICKVKSGVKMDYGSDSDAIQAIYITATEALTATDTTQKEAGEG